MRIKAKEFKKDGANTIDAHDIQSYLYDVKWKNAEHRDLCDVVDDIMSLKFSEVFDYLKVQVIKEASSMQIDDFNELITK